MKYPLSAALAALLLSVFTLNSQADTYKIDETHSFIEFRTGHLGFSWLYGRFNNVSGSFEYDSEKPQATQINAQIDVASIDTNHAERDKHLRSGDFLSTDKFGQATFKSTGYTGSKTEGTLTGELTLHGVTKEISIDVKKVGEGKDPWGGYRAGFIGTYVMTAKDFGYEYELGPSAAQVELEIGIEGIRQ